MIQDFQVVASGLPASSASHRDQALELVGTLMTKEPKTQIFVRSIHPRGVEGWGCQWPDTKQGWSRSVSQAFLISFPGLLKVSQLK